MKIIQAASYICLIAFCLQQMRIASFEDVFNKAKRRIPGLEQIEIAPTPETSSIASPLASPSSSPSAAP
jgi:hypothetical protein